MASVPDGYADDFLEQILAIPSYAAQVNDGSPVDSVVSGTSSSLVMQIDHHGDGSGHGGGSGFEASMFPLGLSLDSGGFQSAEAPPERESLQFSSFGHVQQPYSIPVQSNIPYAQQQAFHGQPVPGMVVSAPQPPAVRPRVRARRGQATDPHSIAERIRRERIAEKVRALQELVPSCNKTDRAAMLDGILEYVKFLRLQVKVLSMSRLGGAGAVAQLVSDIPLSSVEREANEDESNELPWDKWSNGSTEQEVLKLMEEDVGAAMQFLKSKALCIMPTSLAALIYSTQQPETIKLVKPESNGTL